jgi:hypothetical protein
MTIFLVQLIERRSKALDAVNHEIHFDKLEYYGICGLPLQWIKNYFSNRFQFVQYKEYYSSRKKVCCMWGASGLNSWSFIFLLYINDICNVSQLIDIVLFADDTNIFFSHKELQYVINTLNREMENLSDWFQANKLSLNAKNSKFIVC